MQGLFGIFCGKRRKNRGKIRGNRIFFAEVVREREDVLRGGWLQKGKKRSIV